MNGNYWYWLTNLLLCLAIAGCMGGTAGTSEPDPSATAHGFTPAHPAGKPGARVNLEDATPEEITPGAVASREVRLRADYSGGILQVQVTAEEGLEIVSQQREFRFVLEPDNRYSLPLDLFAARPGRYYLNLHIRVESPDSGVEYRAMAVVVKAGDAALLEPAMEAPVQPGGSGKIRSLPARERLEDTL